MKLPGADDGRQRRMRSQFPSPLPPGLECPAVHRPRLPTRLVSARIIPGVLCTVVIEEAGLPIDALRDYVTPGARQLVLGFRPDNGRERLGPHPGAHRI